MSTREAVNAASRKYYATHKAQSVKRVKLWHDTHPRNVRTSSLKAYNARREYLNRVKATPCLDCGIQYSPWVMHFDHRNPSDKKFGIGNTCSHQSFDSLVLEIAKCDVVCANCHAERTHKQLILRRVHANT